MDQIEQGSQEWLELRIGKITASRLSDVLAQGKGSSESLTRKRYKNELIRERLTHQKLDGYSNTSMERGTLLEPLARASYEVQHNLMVEQVSFVPHPVISNAGASPDGLIGDDGLIEIKCPKPENHLEAILTNGKSLISTYYNQIQWQMACTGRKWCDLVSYDPDMIDHLQLFVTKVLRDDPYIKTMEAEVITFDQEIIQAVINLKEKQNG